MLQHIPDIMANQPDTLQKMTTSLLVKVDSVDIPIEIKRLGFG